MTGDHHTLTSGRVDPKWQRQHRTHHPVPNTLSLLPPSEHSAAVGIGKVPLLGTDQPRQGGAAVGIPGESVLQTLGITVSFV